MKISRWNELYENAESRKIINARWLALPNQHDGERYSEIMESKNSLEIFTCWILMLQVASRCKPRGSLLRDNGTPYDSIGLARKTRGKPEWFDIAIPFLLKLAWIEPSGDSPGVPGYSPGSPGYPGTERNGTEGKRKKAHLFGKQVTATMTDGQRAAQAILVGNSIKEKSIF